MKRQSQIDKAIDQLESEIQVLALAVAKLKEQRKEPKLRMAKTRLAPVEKSGS